jgi:hypothetical protein
MTCPLSTLNYNPTQDLPAQLSPAQPRLCLDSDSTPTQPRPSYSQLDSAALPPGHSAMLPCRTQKRRYKTPKSGPSFLVLVLVPNPSPSPISALLPSFLQIRHLTCLWASRKKDRGGSEQARRGEVMAELFWAGWERGGVCWVAVFLYMYTLVGR